MPKTLSAALLEHRKTMEAVAGLDVVIDQAADTLKICFDSGRTVFVCGNGGSASDAQHFAAELTGRFERDRAGFPAIALTTDTSAITAIGNDYGFDRIFARQLESLGRQGDVLIVISTSGNSSNLLETVKQAKGQNIETIGLLGRHGGELAKVVDLAITVPGERTSRIQEAHIFILHHLCEAFEPASI